MKSCCVTIVLVESVTTHCTTDPCALSVLGKQQEISDLNENVLLAALRSTKQLQASNVMFFFLLCFEFLKLTMAETNVPQSKFLKFIEVVTVIFIFSIFTSKTLM